MWFFPSDAFAVGACAFFSICLLVLSYWSASPPTPDVVRRTVENHAAFQLLWTLTFVDILVDKGAVSAKVRTAYFHRLQLLREFRSPVVFLAVGTVQFATRCVPF